MIGRTGVGKSSLINALCGAYVSNVSNTKSCTESVQVYECKDNGRVLMEILDTRGIAESESLDDTISAEDMLIDQINEFSPDVVILILNCTYRDDVNLDVEFLKKVSKSYENINKMKLPIVVVLNKCDEMAPDRFKSPAEYPENKVKKINEVVQYYKGIIVKDGFSIERSGRDISLETAKEFILSMGGIAGVGYTFKLISQQASKLLNAVWPGSGSAVSSGIAALGTSAIGTAAIAYYIDDKTMDEAKKKFEEAKKKSSET